MSEHGVFQPTNGLKINVLEWSTLNTIGDIDMQAGMHTTYLIQTLIHPCKSATAEQSPFSFYGLNYYKFCSYTVENGS